MWMRAQDLRRPGRTQRSGKVDSGGVGTWSRWGLGIVAIAALSACGDGGTGPTDPGTPPVQPPVVPPRADSLTQLIGPTGGSVVFPDGSGVFVPPGAVPGAVPITVMKEDPARWFEPVREGGQVVFEAKAPVARFDREVEFRVRLPATFEAGDSTRVLAGLLDPETGAVEVERATVEMIGGVPFLVLRTDHFSHRFATWWVGPPTPPTRIVLPVPFYSQGDSKYCWAASVQMVSQAARFNLTRSIPSLIARAGVDEGGITIFGFRYGDAITRFVQSSTGVTPERFIWTSGSQLDVYLKRQLGIEGRPVALFLSAESHAVVVTGYETAADGKVTYFVHDPQGLSPGSVGYRPRTTARLLDPIGFVSRAVTLVVPATLQVRNIPISLNFVDATMQFVQLPTSGSEGIRYDFFWEPERGYAFREEQSKTKVRPVPGTVDRLSFPWGIEVSNASQGVEHAVELLVEVWSGATVHLARTLERTVGANQLVFVKPAPIPVDSFRVNTTSPVEYGIRARARPAGGGEVIDDVYFYFELGPVTPQLTALSPVQAAEGQIITLRGTNLGTIPFRNAVLFTPASGGGGPLLAVTDIVSWSNEEVQVRVPVGAGSGPVLLRRGEVPSNSVEFVLDQRQTISGAVNSTLNMGGSIASLTGNWSFTAVAPALEQRTSYDRHILRFNPEGPAEFTLDFSADYAPREWKTQGGETWRVVSVVMVVESDVRASSGSAPVVTESGSGGSRTYVFSNAKRGDSLAISVHYKTFIDRLAPDGTLLEAGWELTSASLSATFIIEGR